MILESVQMLSTTLHHYGMEGPYKVTHTNHPCTVWARQSAANFHWLHRLTRALHKEWQYRWGHTGMHKSWEKWLEARAYMDRKPEWPETGLTFFAQAMPEEYRQDDTVEAYRAYYLGEKKHILKYTKRKAPDWISCLE
jgi:hypothetical protein